MVRNDIKNSSLLKTKFLIYAFNGRTIFFVPRHKKMATHNHVLTKKCVPLWCGLCLFAVQTTAFNEPIWGKNAPSNNGFNIIITYYYTKK